MENLGRRAFLGMTALALGAAYLPSTASGDETKIFRTSKDFRNKLKIPGNLADFLESKGCEIRWENARSLQLTYNGEEIGNASNGIYLMRKNRIHLKRDYSDGTIFHEIGHALWGPHGKDGVFDSREYVGPTRKNFANALKTTERYYLELEDFAKEYSNPEIAEEITINESFAIFFAEWMQDSNFIDKKIPRLYDAMTYRRRGLKSDY